MEESLESNPASGCDLEGTERKVFIFVSTNPQSIASKGKIKNDHEGDPCTLSKDYVR